MAATKNKFTRTDIVLFIILFVALALILQTALFSGNSLVPQKRTVYYKSAPEPMPVYTEPQPRVYDLNELKNGNEPSGASDTVDIRHEQAISKAREWADLEPDVKNRMLGELDAVIAKSKKALEINPNDIMARRILSISQERKKIEMENFEGRSLNKK